MLNIGDPARHLFQFALNGIEVRELMPVIVSVLPNHLVEMDRSCIYARRCTCFHSISFEAQFNQLLRDAMRCRFGDTPAFDLCLTAVHETVEESAVSQNDCLSLHLDA